MIYTLTINPAIDKSTQLPVIKPSKKLRCEKPVFEPGGGGVNVSRAIHKLGGHSLCFYTAGGRTGAHMTSLLEAEGIPQQAIAIEDWTRENFIVTEQSTQHQYRFGMPGPVLTDEEQKSIIDHLRDSLNPADFLVASGSLPSSVSDKLYARVAGVVKECKAKLILDTSGPALRHAAKTGVYLLKPNLGEVSALLNRQSLAASDIESAADLLLDEGYCQVAVISLGAKGAYLAGEDVRRYITAPTVHQISAVGAGDSMVGGITYALSQKRGLLEAVQYGVACGSAAAMTPGTELCRKEDVEQLFTWIKMHQEA